MVIALENTYLSWDLGTQVEYTAGEELGFNLHFSAPVAGKYYLMGAFYTKELAYIPGTLFSIYVPSGVDYGIGSTGYTSVWELEPEGSVDLPCRLALDRSDIVLGLFLFRMEGDEPSLGIDEEIASISTELVSPAPGWTWESITGMVAAVMFLGMLGFMMYGAFKE